MSQQPRRLRSYFQHCLAFGLTGLLTACSGGSGEPVSSLDFESQNVEAYSEAIVVREVRNPQTNELQARFRFSWRSYPNRTESDSSPKTELHLEIMPERFFPFGFEYQVDAISDAGVLQVGHVGAVGASSRKTSHVIGVIATNVLRVDFLRFSIGLEVSDTERYYGADS